MRAHLSTRSHVWQIRDSGTILAMNTDASTAPPVTALAFGFKRFTDTYLSHLDTERGGLRIDFRRDDDLRRLHENHPHVVMLPIEAPAAQPIRPSGFWKADPNEFTSVVKSVFSAVSNAASVCFYLTSYTPDSIGASGEFDSNWHAHLQDNLAGYYFLSAIRRHLLPLGTAVPLIVPRRNEFEPFFDRFGAAWHELKRHGEKDTPRSVDLVAQVGDGSTVAIACPARRGHLFWLPTRSPTGDDECTELAYTMARCILTYVSREIGDEPNWAQQFVFEGEVGIRKKHAEAVKTLEAIKPDQERFALLRRIIWARDHGLHRAVVDFLEALGVDTEVDERYLEDFWVKEKGSRSVICEVRATNTNVRPTSLADIVSHRAQQGHDVDFPALLVARPFASRPEVVDQQVEPNVRRRAEQDNVVILRTLDLANFYNLVARGRATVGDLLAQLHSGGGWLKVGAKGMTKLSR